MNLIYLSVFQFMFLYSIIKLMSPCSCAGISFDLLYRHQFPGKALHLDGLNHTGVAFLGCHVGRSGSYPAEPFSVSVSGHPFLPHVVI